MSKVSTESRKRESCVTGPWQQPEPQRLTPAERRAAIREAIVCRRNIIRLAEVQEIEQIAQRKLVRMEPSVKRLGRLDVLREVRRLIPFADERIKDRRQRIYDNAESLLMALLALDDEVSDNEAGCLLGIHEVHVGRAGGLLKAASRAPVPAAVASVLLDRIVSHVMVNPILHRRARAAMNDTLDLDLELPARPRPTAV